MNEAAHEYHKMARQRQRDQLVLDNLPLVRHVLGRMIGQLPTGVDTENLESAGVVGLVEAANKFDPSRGAQFRTFAYMRVRGAILDELRRNSMLPQQALDRISAVKHARSEISGPATVEKLAQYTGLTEDEVADTLATISWTRPLSWEDAVKQYQSMWATTAARPDADLEVTEQLHELAQAVEALPERERTLLTLYYRDNLRLKEISEVVGLSVSRISRILTSVLFNLRESLRQSYPDQEESP